MIWFYSVIINQIRSPLGQQGSPLVLVRSDRYGSHERVRSARTLRIRKARPSFCRDFHVKNLNQLSHLPVSVKVLKWGPNLDTTGTSALSFGINFWKRWSRFFFFFFLIASFLIFTDCVSMLINSNGKEGQHCLIALTLLLTALLSSLRRDWASLALRATRDPYSATARSPPCMSPRLPFRCFI